MFVYLSLLSFVLLYFVTDCFDVLIFSLTVIDYIEGSSLSLMGLSDGRVVSFTKKNWLFNIIFVKLYEIFKLSVKQIM